MRDKILKATRNAFGFAPDVDFDVSRFADSKRAQAIPGLAPLLLLLAPNNDTAPKIIAEALERVIVQIKIKMRKDSCSIFETAFHQEIKRLIHDPQYAEESSTNSTLTERKP
jgi:hypothetical protein